MNKYFVEKIYEILEAAIDDGYAAGVKSIMKQSGKGKNKKRKYSEKKSPKLRVDYTGYDEDAIFNFKMNAFLVAGVGSYELEEDLKKSGVEIMESEEPDFDSFELEVRQKMLNYGIGLSDQPPSGWIKQNIDTAIKNSLAGARFNRATDPSLKGMYVAWRYETLKDERVREEHAALDGLVFDINDEEAQKIIPPVDWGCRCSEQYLTSEETEGADIVEKSQVAGKLKEVPEEFQYNPGNGKHAWRRWLTQKYHDMPEIEYKKIKKLIKQKFN